MIEKNIPVIEKLIKSRYKAIKKKNRLSYTKSLFPSLLRVNFDLFLIAVINKLKYLNIRTYFSKSPIKSK